MSPQQPQATQSSLHSFFRPRPPASQGKSANDAVDLTESPPASPPAKRARLAAITEGLKSAQANPPSVPRSKSNSRGGTSSYFKPPHARTRGASQPNPGAEARRKALSASQPQTPNAELLSYRLPKISKALDDGTPPSGSAFGRYTLPPLSQPLPPPTPRGAEEERRREEWQRLAGNVLPRRRSLALDEAAAAEMRRAAGIDDGESEEGREGKEGTGDAEEKTEEDSLAATLRAKYTAAEPAGTKRGRKKKEEEVGPSGMTYTPLEKQYMALKAKWPDVLLLMEVGYKYKFHGDDAKSASKELGIMAFPSRNFYTASIPTHRLHIHVKKLISLGYKVGVVSQMETAALKKAGDNRNTPFVRELTHLYTAATYVEESSSSSSNLQDNETRPGSGFVPTNALVAIIEKEDGERYRIALVSVVPNTGAVVWDEFHDSSVRSELETRLTHLQPAELLLPTTLSKPTEKVLKHLTGMSRSATAIRVERFEDVMDYNTAFDYLTKFYKGKADDVMEIDLTGDDEEDVASPAEHHEDENMDAIGVAAGLPAEKAVLALVDFPKQIVIALAMVIKYLTPFGLQNAFRHRSSFTHFVNRAHMLLSSNTLINLEVYRNQTDGGQYGSLLWLLDHTKTRMGRRLMREWIGRPLLDIDALTARQDAVEEFMTGNTYHLEKMRSLLVNMPDLVRGLTRIQYAKATPTELATILVGLARVGSEFKPDEGRPFKSELLNNIIATLPTIAEDAKGFLNAIDVKAARADEKAGLKVLSILTRQADLWTDPDRYPQIQDAKDCISICESELNEHLKEVRKIVRRPALNYVTVSGIEYLVEVPVRDAKTVPPKWVKISATKSVVRFHTPQIMKILKEREQHKETLNAAAKRAFEAFQLEISEVHSLVTVSRQLAVIDCLISLATVALASGYCRPKFVSQPHLKIKAGRHPMVESLREEAYVPFDVEFSDMVGRAKVITGPNMAGKSSCVRAIALIVCMAQIGSFVPAEAATLGIHDAVQTRMGASDEIHRGKSTFMVEMSETSDILRTVTPRTLVILDELGRGTSTYDGVAIAYATLAYLAQVGCNTLFVTHYPLVAEQLANEFPEEVTNWHMAFTDRKLPDGSSEITFLYRLRKGLADASFGVWCARLAGLPEPLLARAQERADDLKRDTRERGLAALATRWVALTRAIEAGGGLREAEKVESALSFLVV